jgi:hypothetical protein
MIRMSCLAVPAALWLAGKRIGRRWLGQLNAVGELIFFVEEGTGRTYLMDTAAAVGVVPFCGHSATATAYLTGPDNTVIPAWGSVQLQLRFGGRTFAGDFVQAAVSKPILGVDFLARHKLLLDAASRRMLDAQSLQPLTPPSIPCRRSPLATAVGHMAPAVRELLTAFPKIVSDGNVLPQLRHGVEQVSAASISPLPKHVEALQRLPVPTYVKELQRFLGLINFYRRFCLG